jgi:4-hydroxybenzoate polyprenyltransferase
MVYPKLPSEKTLVRRKIKKTKIRKFDYLSALRPRQWTKNLIVFAASLFAFQIYWQSFLASLLAFILFCCTSSGFYLINDICDIESDRQHPIKCQRAIASGKISIPIAILIAAILLVGSLIIAWWKSPALGITILAYDILQIAYNLKLKHTLLLDIIAIATGFVLRAYGGAASANIPLSSWFLVCIAMLALFLAIEKRKAELRLIPIQRESTRAVLGDYSLALLTRMENIVTTGTIMTYTIWSSGPRMNGASTSWMMVTLPFVFYGIFRYQFLSEPQKITQKSDRQKSLKTERPEEILLKDKPILLTVVCWIATVFTILLLKHQGWIN